MIPSLARRSAVSSTVKPVKKISVSWRLRGRGLDRAWDNEDDWDDEGIAGGGSGDEGHNAGAVGRGADAGKVTPADRVSFFEVVESPGINEVVSMTTLKPSGPVMVNMSSAENTWRDESCSAVRVGTGSEECDFRVPFCGL